MLQNQQAGCIVLRSIHFPADAVICAWAAFEYRERDFCFFSANSPRVIFRSDGYPPFAHNPRNEGFHQKQSTDWQRHLHSGLLPRCLFWLTFMLSFCRVRSTIHATTSTRTTCITFRSATDRIQSVNLPKAPGGPFQSKATARTSARWTRRSPWRGTTTDVVHRP
jgi:hypothetical protein